MRRCTDARWQICHTHNSMDSRERERWGKPRGLLIMVVLEGSVIANTCQCACVAILINALQFLIFAAQWPLPGATCLRFTLTLTWFKGI